MIKHFKCGDILRHKKTGEALYVIQKFPTGILVYSLADTHNPVDTKMLLERDFSNWVNEFDMEHKEVENPNNGIIVTRWHYHRVSITP